MIKKNKNILLIVGIICLMISAICFVSYSNTDIQEVIIKSMTPIYDEESTVLVENTNVTFNDKEQVVKYNVVVQNNENYDVKVTDLKLGTKSQEFLKYEVENVELDEVIKPGETKELVISFETVKMDGWGRNFNDELVTTLVFDRVLINPEPSVPNNNPNNEVPKVETVPDNSGNVVVQPEVNEPVLEEPKEEVNNDVVTTPEDDANHELGMNQEIIVKDAHNEDLIVIFCFGVATGVLGIGLVMVNKNKFTKYIVLFVIVGSSVKLASANEVFSLEIPINVIYESQNIMKPSGCVYDDDFDGNLTCEDFWSYNSWIKKIYIENEINEFAEWKYRFDVSANQNEKVIATLIINEEDSSKYDLYIQADGIIYANTDASYYFAWFLNLSEIINLNGLDVSMVENMSRMFWDAGSNVDEFHLNLNSWNTSNVTDMSEMFRSACYKCENFTLDVSGFDTSKVTNMDSMFSHTGLQLPAFTLDVSGFETSNVTDMSWMFYLCGRYSEKLEIDVSNFNTSKVTDMSGMFCHTGEYNPNFVLDVSNFDTSNVTDMYDMFSSTGYNNPNFTLDVSGFDTSKVTDMSYMFSGTGYSNNNFTLDLSNFDTSNVTNMSGMFSSTGYNSKILILDVSNFDTSKVTNMRSMFYKTGYNSTNVTIDVSNFDTSNVTNMSYMFNETGYNSTVLNTSITIRNKDVVAGKDYYKDMFKGVATKPGSQIMVNYTNDTKDIIDLVIATKSSNSNVVKGWNVDNEMISFDIEGTTYNAIEGMTWEQWVNSEFNTDGYNTFGFIITKEENTKMVVGPEASNKITKDYSYRLEYIWD